MKGAYNNEKQNYEDNKSKIKGLSFPSYWLPYFLWKKEQGSLWGLTEEGDSKDYFLSE